MKTQKAISKKAFECELEKKILPPDEAKFIEKLLLIIDMFPEYFT